MQGDDTDAGGGTREELAAGEQTLIVAFEAHSSIPKNASFGLGRADPAWGLG